MQDGDATDFAGMLLARLGGEKPKDQTGGGNCEKETHAKIAGRPWVRAG